MANYNVDNVFSYHPPTGDQSQRYNALRDLARNFAHEIVANTPASREQSLALTKLQEVVMFANAAIAINEQPPATGDDQSPVTPQ